MGYPNNNHIRAFARGQTIKEITELPEGAIVIDFQNGESLRLWPKVKTQSTPQLETIATPFRSDGEVKQTTEIAV